VRALIGVEKVFGTELAADPRFVAAVTERLARLLAHGAKRAVAMEEGAG
jgi:fructuronate reductase